MIFTNLHLKSPFFYFIVLFLSIHLLIIPAPKNVILSQGPFVPHAFETLDEVNKHKIEKSDYKSCIESFNLITDAKFQRITYSSSNNLKVTGILACPTKAPRKGTLAPVIIYNRGGFGELGKITVKKMVDFIYPFVQAGYIVVASQYRGNDGSEGTDENGGSDVDDVIALREVIKELPHADQNNIFMIGSSRGAVNSYRTLQQNAIPIRACAVLGGLTNFMKFKPEERRALLDHVPNYHQNPNSELTKRSAICWPQDISAPLLLIHGDQDPNLRDTRELESGLAAHNKIYNTIVYPNGGHSLNGHNLAQAIEEIKAWFKTYASAR